MAEGLDIVAVPGIAALPPTTARQIGSGQVLVDPSSVVKELIDNALDARAKSIFVDITANTIESIQVKDDGHGIPAEDRSLVCRRSCTSKIRDFHDLRQVGGKWLGFRGEALSSMAEMSSLLCVTTRVEGEPVAVKLKYGRDGELASVEHDSHPVGTTVKVTKFFDFIPVRKQTASKNSAKLLAKIRRLMQAYALARPTIRFRLRVLKAKNNNGDFVYAPKTDANVEDAALKLIGKDCALQCDWTALEADGFEVHAFLPKPGANGPKISDQGAFVSIDARPVSGSRGTIKRIITACRDWLRKSNPSLAGVKDPFLCLNIICPPDSYDPNIEPAKDDVMFDNSDVVIAVVDKLLKAYYPEPLQEVQGVKPLTSAQRQCETQPKRLSSRVERSLTAHEDEPTGTLEESPTNITQALPRWRSSMYGIDEDDLELLQQDHRPLIGEEEDGLRSVEISNPWTIARMNAKVKPKQAVSNEQLLSPAKSQGGGDLNLSSPSPVVTPHRPHSTLPLTPQTSSQTSIARSLLDAELEHSIQHVPRPSSAINTFDDMGQDRTTDVRRRVEFNTSPIHTGVPNNFTQLDVHRISSRLPNFSQYLTGTQPSQPVPQKHASPTSRRPVASAAEGRTPHGIYSSSHIDIRDFFDRSMQLPQPPSQRKVSAAVSSRASSANPQPRSRRVRDHLLLDADREMSADLRDMAQQSQRFSRRQGPPRASSVGSQMTMLFDQRSAGDGNAQSVFVQDGNQLEAHNTTCQFQIHDHAFPHSPASRHSDTPSERPLILQRPSQLAATSDAHRLDNSAKEMEAYFRSQEQQHNSSPSRPNNTSQKQEPRIAPPHETSSQTRRPRRRTTDALERTKSTKVPLERTRKGFQAQNLILLLPTDVHTIVQQFWKLDMRRNGPEWGHPAGDAYDTFAEPVFEKKITEWVVKIDALLGKRYERIDGVDTKCEIHEGIQRALDARKETDAAILRIEDTGRRTGSSAVGTVEVGVSRDSNDATGIVVQQPAVEAERKLDDGDEYDFDMEQCIDLTAEDKRQIFGTADEGNVEVTKSEYDGDIEDDMLMDL
ncbi:hypothetical protein G6011_07317 [Alternaria panax]|uniref:DNA mismatch repair protein S5 domain-containing protein n=1 Tax=Alternaria panax TaxID=48097 RepID=A0AAD4FF12_9PLEO|nr:hypothetical protein G6011_07317 [Alternaria panax]